MITELILATSIGYCEEACAPVIEACAPVSEACEPAVVANGVFVVARPKAFEKARDNRKQRISDRLQKRAERIQSR